MKKWLAVKCMSASLTVLKDLVIYYFMDNKKKIGMYIVLSVAGLGLTGFLATSIVPQVFVTMTKAAPATQVSLADSYVLADKIIALADGVDEAKVNVYVMDKSGKGVAGKTVQLAGEAVVEPEVVQSSSEGKASFKIKSTNEGQVKLTATVEGVTLPREVTVTFRN